MVLSMGFKIHVYTKKLFQEKWERWEKSWTKVLMSYMIWLNVIVVRKYFKTLTRKYSVNYFIAPMYFPLSNAFKYHTI